MTTTTIARHRWYPVPPPALQQEDHDAYTRRITGPDHPYDHERRRECAMGYHLNCSDTAGARCQCPHHTDLVPDVDGPAKAATTLADLYFLPMTTALRVMIVAQNAVESDGVTTKIELAARLEHEYGSPITDGFTTDVAAIMRELSRHPQASPEAIKKLWATVVDSPSVVTRLEPTPAAEPAPCPDCQTAPGQPHVDGCDHAACPDCGEQLLICEHEADRAALWHGIDQREWIAAELGWWTDHPDTRRVADFERVAEAVTRGYLSWDQQEQRYHKARFIGAANLTMVDLVAALRAGAGAVTDQAAIELLAEHGNWLDRTRFRHRFMTYSDDPNVTGGPAMAWVDWIATVKALDDGTLLASGAEGPILRIAASLGSGVPVSLRDTVTNGLGRAHAAMVVKAIVRATGIVEPVGAT